MAERRTQNLDLRPLPSDDEIVEAVRVIVAAEVERGRPWTHATAGDVAHRLDVQPANRLGRSASKGNWSGTMAPGTRLAPAMARLARQGRLVKHRFDEPDRSAFWCYEVADDPS